VQHEINKTIYYHNDILKHKTDIACHHFTQQNLFQQREEALLMLSASQFYNNSRITELVYKFINTRAPANSDCQQVLQQTLTQISETNQLLGRYFY